MAYSNVLGFRWKTQMDRLHASSRDGFACAFFLGRQNQLESVRLQRREIRGGSAAEAPPLRALVTTGLQTLSQLLPALCLVGSKLRPREGTQPRGGIGYQLYRTAQPSSWRGALPSCRSPCVIAIRTKKLCEIVLGARESRHAIAVEQPRPITVA